MKVRVQVPPTTVPAQLSAPALTMTLPVGVPAPGAAAVTGKVIANDSPVTVALLGLFVIVATVLALLTVCVKAAAVLAKKLPSPL